MVKILIDKYPDMIDVKNDRGKTPLKSAAGGDGKSPPPHFHPKKNQMMKFHAILIFSLFNCQNS